MYEKHESEDMSFIRTYENRILSNEAHRKRYYINNQQTSGVTSLRPRWNWKASIPQAVADLGNQSLGVLVENSADE